MNGKKRCKWCNLKNEKYVDYHDNEWGVLNLNENYLYEMLILESFQAGLSWECVLNKRDFFRVAYDGFDVTKVANYGEDEIQKLLANEGIIRNKLKINASVKNSKIYKQIASKFGSFKAYLLSFWNGNVICETGKTTNSLSDAISSDLKRKGMAFVGSTTIYSYLQAIGVIYSHEEGCYLFKRG